MVATLSIKCCFSQPSFVRIIMMIQLLKLRQIISVSLYIYIYIYSHQRTDCFVLSELFSVARHAGRSKTGLKPVQLYVRMCFRPLVHQADHVGQGNFKVFLFLETAAAAFVYIFFNTLSATRVLNSFEELRITLVDKKTLIIIQKTFQNGQ